MENIKLNINNTFYHLFNMKHHPFFMDIERVNKISKDYINFQKTAINKTIKYKKTSIPKGKNINIKYKNILTNKDILQLNKQLDTVLSYKNILKIVSKISKYLIKSNVDNQDILFNKFKNSKDTINICIIGAGPTGLYLASYLYKYYNEGKLNSYPKVNIVIFDNRINKSKFRKPYSRHRPFATSSNYLPLVLPKLYCYENNKNSVFFSIYVLEYMLFAKVMLNYKIPIIFEDYGWNDYKNIFKKADIDVVFDCSGGRLEVDIFKNLNTDWMKKINKVNKKISKQLLINKEKNLVHLIDYPKEKKFKKNNFYGSLLVYDKKLNFINKYDIDIVDEGDLILLNKLKKIYYSYDDVNNILPNFRDYVCRNFLYNIISNNENKYKDFLFIFDVWTIYIRHTIQPSEIFKVNKKNILYIGAGDTIFHSHFITGAGLNRTIAFATKCANLLTLLKK